MELQKLYRLIDLQPEIVGRLEQIRGEINLAAIDPYLEQLMDRETAEQAYDHLQILFRKEADNDNIKMLYCQLECAGRVFDKYQEKHIPQDIYADTMKCFTRFIAECEKKNGRMFFDRDWWTYRQISMSLFRIGELEYEFCEQEGEPVIAIHIPSDAALSKDTIGHSLEQAGIFFRTYYPEYIYDKYTCDSWLLSPALRPLLSDKSNILSFQDYFTILREDTEDKDYIEWLFQVPADTEVKDLPAATSLQKKVKETLMNGGAIGSAYGVIRKGE